MSDNRERARRYVETWLNPTSDWDAATNELASLLDAAEARGREGDGWRPIADAPTVERVARALCKAKGISPDYCVLGSGSIGTRVDGTPFSTSECHRYAWQDECAAAAAAIAALPAPPEWRPIADAPRDGTEVWVYCKRFDGVVPARWVEGFGVWGDTWVTPGYNQPWASSPTHWQPIALPAPPVEGGGG